MITIKILISQSVRPYIEILLMMNSCPRSTHQKGELSVSLVLMQLVGLLSVSKTVSVSPLMTAEQSPVILSAWVTCRELMLQGLLSAMFSASIHLRQCWEVNSKQ